MINYILYLQLLISFGCLVGNIVETFTPVIIDSYYFDFSTHTCSGTI